jgi:DinB superfamily
MSESVDRISSVMAGTPRRWLDLTETAPGDLLERPAAAGEWSAVDCLRHLLQSERHVFSRRIEQFLAGDEELTLVDPASIPPAAERTAREMAEAFARAREENLRVVAGLRPEDLERTSRSRRFGQVTLGLSLRQMALHDLEHLMQAERALFQGLLVDSGPLRAAYAALDVEASPAEAPAS